MVYCISFLSALVVMAMSFLASVMSCFLFCMTGSTVVCCLQGLLVVSCLLFYR